MTERQPVVTDDLQRFVELVATLRRDCPWDAEQTHSSLRSYLLEEAHELLEALDAYDEATGSGSEDLKEELGDLLFQVVFHARIAADDGRFDLADVARGIHDKLRHRHPHVFGDVVVEDSGQVLTNWDRIKQAEKGRESALDGIPSTLPSLAAAQKVVRRAGGLGLEPDGPVGDPSTDPDALGDLLLSLAAMAHDDGLDAEDALRGAVARFARLVRRAEALAAADGVDLREVEPAVVARYRKRALAESGHG